MMASCDDSTIGGEPAPAPPGPACSSRDVDEGQDHAVDDVVERAVRQDPQDVPRRRSSVRRTCRSRGDERAQDLLDVRDQVAAREARGDVGDRPADVASMRRKTSVAAGVNLLMRSSRSTKTVAIRVLWNRF